MLTVQLAAGARLEPHALPDTVKSAGFVPVIATLLREIAVAPPFCNVVGCEALLEPTLTVPKESDEGFTAILPGELVPLPERETVSAEIPPVWLNVSVAVRAPAADGTKSTVAVQLEPAARVAAQVLAGIEKSPAFAPEIATPRIVIADVPSLVSVTISAFPADPTGTLAQDTLLGEAVTITDCMQPVCGKAQHARNEAKRIAPAGLSPFAILGLESPRARAEDIAEWRNETRARPKLRPADAFRRKLSA
jgi:hypothetical protein